MDTRSERRQRGFTLIELLITIVVVGILSSIAIVGFGGLTHTATSATCKPTMDAAKVAVTSYYTRQEPNVYPTSFATMVASKDLELHGGVRNPSPTTLSDASSAGHWTITLDPGTGKLTATGTAAAHCG